MSIAFLCPKHREWIYSHPDHALSFLAKDEQQGKLLFVDGQLRESIPYLGCAFDIAAILVELDDGENPSLCLKIAVIAELLCIAFSTLRLYDQERALRERAARLTAFEFNSVSHTALYAR